MYGVIHKGYSSKGESNTCGRLDANYDPCIYFGKFLRNF